MNIELIDFRGKAHVFDGGKYFIQEMRSHVSVIVLRVMTIETMPRCIAEFFNPVGYLKKEDHA